MEVDFRARLLWYLPYVTLQTEVLTWGITLREIQEFDSDSGKGYSCTEGFCRTVAGETLRWLRSAPTVVISQLPSSG